MARDLAKAEALKAKELQDIIDAQRLSEEIKVKAEEEKLQLMTNRKEEQRILDEQSKILESLIEYQE